MAEPWWQLQSSGLETSTRPAGSSTSVFTTLALTSLDAQAWSRHSVRLGAPPAWLAHWDRALDALHTLSAAGAMMARIVHDPESQSVWLSLRPTAPTPARIILQPSLAQWPSYNQKWWQRETYQRQLPTHEGDIRYERLLVDPHTQEVWETDTANVIIEKKGRLYTPDPTGTPLLWGTTIQQLAMARPILRQSITLGALYEADQIWICNAVLGMQRAELAR